MEWVPKVSLGLITTCHARDLEWNPNSLTMTCKWSDPYPPLTFISEPSSWSSLLRSCPPFFFCPMTIAPFWCWKFLCMQLLWPDASPLLACQGKHHLLWDIFVTILQREVHTTPFFLQFSLFPSLIEISIHFIFVSVDWWLGNNLPYWTMAESENDLFHRRGKVQSREVRKLQVETKLELR